MRQFTYLDHKDNYPLQLKGNMLRKSRNVPSYCNRKETTLPDEAKNKILQKMANNSTNYSNWKYSCLPFQDNYGKKIKKQSIKTYQQKENCSLRSSGATYLFNKSSISAKFDKERKHLRQWSSFRKQRKQKKHYHDANSSVLFPNESLVASKKTQDQELNQKRRSESLINKINNDLHTDFQGHQSKPQTFGRKAGRTSLFRQGFQIGYDLIRQKQISKQKLSELAGNVKISCPSEHQSVKSSKQRNCDWRRSSLQIG